MKVWGLTKEEIEMIVSIVSKRDYESNIILEYEPKQLSKRTNCYQVKLRCISAKQIGSRYNAGQSRRLISCSWEVFRDVIQEMFNSGANRVQTAFVDYRSAEDFQKKYRDTANHRIGSMVQPTTIGEVTNYEFERRK
jgi:hypothetical protein